MTENRLISVREGLRSPRNFLARLVRQPGSYARAFLHQPRQLLFGFHKPGLPADILVAGQAMKEAGLDRSRRLAVAISGTGRASENAKRKIMAQN
jgi:hypothetical protein